MVIINPFQVMKDHIKNYITRRVPHVELELFTLPEHLSSSPVISGVYVARSLVVYVMICPVMRCFTASDYSFGIFKLFIYNNKR